MAIVLRNPAQLKPLERTIEGPFGSVTLRARRPTVRESLESGAAATQSDRMHARLKVFVGWEGVLDEEGQPIPFTEAAFSQACEQLPELLWSAVEFARDIFNGQGDEPKNSNAPPPSGFAAAPEPTQDLSAGNG